MTKYREKKQPHLGVIDDFVDVFKENGILRWGGDWNYPIDYMHFEIYRDNAVLFLTMTKSESLEYFKLYQKFYNTCKRKFKEEYEQRNFNDLSRAIARKEYNTPINIYLHGGGRD